MCPRVSGRCNDGWRMDETRGARPDGHELVLRRLRQCNSGRKRERTGGEQIAGFVAQIIRDWAVLDWAVLDWAVKNGSVLSGAGVR